LTLNLQPEGAGNCTFPVEAVIFDLDGTLVNTIDVYFRVIDEVLVRLNLPALSREVIMDAAKDGEFKWVMMIPEKRRAEKEDLLRRMWAVRDELFPVMLREGTTLIPGAEDLLKKLRDRGARIGLVTSTPKKNLENKWIPLEDCGIRQFFDAVVTADDVEERKPSPEALIACAGKIGVKAERCLSVGDVRTDIVAGKGAGMITVGVLTGFDTYDQLKAESPDLIVGSVADLLQRLV